MRACYSLLH